MNKYRVSGVETRNQKIDDEEAAIRYSLKVGDGFITDRLDVPKRLVITTYQTLRDYQFSLCAIDWAVVAFDEAQNIKNPNALQTRAAKGLKAEFRLLATGTPVENSLADFWCIMDTACPGYLGSYQEFRERYVAPILRAAGDEVEEIRARVGRALRDTVGALMLRRLKEDNLEGLPQKRLFVGVSDSDWEYLDTLSSVTSGEQLDSYDSVLQATAQSEQNAAGSDGGAGAGSGRLAAMRIRRWRRSFRRGRWIAQELNERRFRGAGRDARPKGPAPVATDAGRAARRGRGAHLRGSVAPRHAGPRIGAAVRR